MNKADFFNLWAPSYDWLLPSAFYQAIHIRLLEYVQLSEQAAVLDMGCGTGKLLNRLAETSPQLTGIGIDFAFAMVEQATLKTPYSNRLQFIRGDANNLPFDEGTFDEVFCSISFLHYPDPARALCEVARVLRSGGHFYLADFLPPPWAKADTVIRGLTPNGIRFYNAQARANLGDLMGLHCDRHDYLLGPVMLTRFSR